MNSLVLGVGMSSKATRADVVRLVEEVLAMGDSELANVAVVATRARFVHDERLWLGISVVGIDDDNLLERFAAPRRVGIAARVAEGCALLGAGENAQLLVGPVHASYVTVALAQSACDRREQ